jgi:hypothetical protein
MEEGIYCVDRRKVVRVKVCYNCPYAKGCKDLRKYYKKENKI